MTLDYTAHAANAVGAVLPSSYRVARAQYHVTGRAGSDARVHPANRTARIRQMAVEVLVSGQPDGHRIGDDCGAETAGSPT